MLSLIVTFYDEIAFLRTALRSVCNQGIDDLDLIVVNDNPDKFSRKDLQELTRGFGARIVQHTENQGLSAARNTGVVAANGDLIGFLDADDYFTPGGLAEQLAYAIETGADITHAATYLGAESSVHTSLLHRDAALHMQHRVISGRMAAQEAQFIVSSWSSLYRADFLAKNDLWFDAEQRKFEDRLFVLHAVTAARKVAFLGKPVRVWRRRANSISSSATTPQTHLLQVQLLEKCMAHMRAETSARALPPRFEKRELFNTVSRLIWDMDILAPLAVGDPDYADMGPRIVALLGNDSFGQDIFADPMVAATSRVGMQTKHGLISRTDFFALHKAWRCGDFETARTIMQARLPKTAAIPAKADHPQKRLIVHIGLHKTGTTYLQHHLLHHRATLLDAGILLPQTGFDTEINGRPGALSGHQGLVRALRQQDDTVWADLHDEISASPAHTVILSAENLSFPTEADRDALIAQLFTRLGAFKRIDVVAVLRAPHRYVEAFYAEWVTSAHPAGARSIHETLVDHGARLTDMAQLLAPFEAGAGRPAILGDFDAFKAGQGLWHSFCTLTGLPDTLPEHDVPRYPTPDRASTALMQLLNTTVASRARRQRLMQTYFADTSRATEPQDSLLSPAESITLLDQFEETSGAFCAARGYTPDVAALRKSIAAQSWSPQESIPISHLHAILDTGAQVAGDTGTSHRPSAVQDITETPPAPSRYSFTIRPRPWLVQFLDKITGKG